MIELTFLGTSSMVPTKERNHSALFLSFKSDGILIDCGEGTQRQMKMAGIGFSKISKILITHWHGDHTLGLPGLLQSMAASQYDKTLHIYGPKTSKKRFAHMFEAFPMDKKIDMEIHEIEDNLFFENRDFALEAVKLRHGIPCFGFRFFEKDRRRMQLAKIKKLGIPDGPLLGKLQRGQSVTWKDKKITPEDTTKIVKGKIIGIISDTQLCDGCYAIAKDADLLISESTYASTLQDKSDDYNHMTAKNAALVASKSNVKKLILTHFSARYKSTLELNEDARTYFDNTECAYDLMKVKL